MIDFSCLHNWPLGVPGLPRSPHGADSRTWLPEAARRPHPTPPHPFTSAVLGNKAVFKKAGLLCLPVGPHGYSSLVRIALIHCKCNQKDDRTAAFPASVWERGPRVSQLHSLAFKKKKKSGQLGMWSCCPKRNRGHWNFVREPSEPLAAQDVVASRHRPRLY